MILAIDPGNEQSAWCLLDSKTLKPINFSKDKNRMVDVTIRFAPSDVVVIERIASYGMAVGKEVFETCEWVGRFSCTAESCRIPVAYVYRKDEKLNLCGTTKAKDANIRQALIDRFGPVGTKKNPGWFYGVSKDVWSAIAVAVTYADKQRDMKQFEGEEA